MVRINFNDDLELRICFYVDVLSDLILETHDSMLMLYFTTREDVEQMKKLILSWAFI